MAEILIRVTDKVNEDFYRNTKCTKRGDVIVVQGDGWAWGMEELTASYWRIVKLPQCTVSELSVFLMPEPETDPQNPSKTLQRRWYLLDVDNVNITGQFRIFINDDTRAEPSFTSQLTFAQIESLQLKVQKPPIEDPNVIGESPNIL